MNFPLSIVFVFCKINHITNKLAGLLSLYMIVKSHANYLIKYRSFWIFVLLYCHSACYSNNTYKFLISELTCVFL